jgi:hypothetical protein
VTVFKFGLQASRLKSWADSWLVNDYLKQSSFAAFANSPFAAFA